MTKSATCSKILFCYVSFFSSFVTSATKNHMPNYQLLEFIGDTVLELCVQSNKYRQIPTISEEISEQFRKKFRNNFGRNLAVDAMTSPFVNAILPVCANLKS